MRTCLRHFSASIADLCKYMKFLHRGMKFQEFENSRTSPLRGDRVHRGQKALPNRALTDEGRPSCVCPAVVLSGAVRAFPSGLPSRFPLLLFFPDISSERLRVYRDRSPALVLWKSRLGYVYWDGFSNALSVPRGAFRGPYPSLT